MTRPKKMVLDSSPLDAPELTKSFYSMGEVSEMLGIPAPTLRFYESKFPQIKPGRTPGGQRRYRPSDIEKLKMALYLVRDRKLHIEAARADMTQNSDMVKRRAQTLERLRAVRDSLQGICDALHKFR